MKKLKDLDRGLVMLLGLTVFTGASVATNIDGLIDTNKKLQSLQEERTEQIEFIKESEYYQELVKNNYPEFDIEEVNVEQVILDNKKVEEFKPIAKIDKQIEFNKKEKGYYKLGVKLGGICTALFGALTGLAIYQEYKEDKEKSDEIKPENDGDEKEQ